MSTVVIFGCKLLGYHLVWLLWFLNERGLGGTGVPVCIIGIRMSLTSGYLRLCNKLIKNPRGCMYPDTTLIWLVLVGYVAWKVDMYGGGCLRVLRCFYLWTFFSLYCSSTLALSMASFQSVKSVAWQIFIKDWDTDIIHATKVQAYNYLYINSHGLQTSLTCPGI